VPQPVTVQSVPASVSSIAAGRVMGCTHSVNSRELFSCNNFR